VTRQRPSLRAPARGETLDTFPSFTLNPRRTLWRLVREGHGPWWFGSTLQGRFDLPAPNGTCYLASDDLGAILETLGPDLLPGGLAPMSLLNGRHLHALQVPTARRVANSLVQRASRWVTAEISTITPYFLPQAWAAALHGAGFDGIRYGPRHSPSRRTVAFALFGAAGERDWPSGAPGAVSAQHRERLRQRCGITLFEMPFHDELAFAPDPGEA
jgi:RES domain